MVLVVVNAKCLLTQMRLQSFVIIRKIFKYDSLLIIKCKEMGQMKESASGKQEKEGTFRLVTSPRGPMIELARMLEKATTEAKVRIKVTVNIMFALKLQRFLQKF